MADGSNDARHMQSAELERDPEEQSRRDCRSTPASSPFTARPTKGQVEHEQLCKSSVKAVCDLCQSNV